MNVLGQSARGVWVSCRKVSSSDTVISHPLSHMMSHSPVLVWWVYLFFTQPHTPPQDGVGVGGGAVIAEICSETPQHLSLTERKTESSPQPAGLA